MMHRFWLLMLGCLGLHLALLLLGQRWGAGRASPARHDLVLEGCVLPCWERPADLARLHQHLRGLQSHYPSLGASLPALESSGKGLDGNALLLGRQSRLRVGDLLLLYGPPERGFAQRSLKLVLSPRQYQWYWDVILYWQRGSIYALVTIPGERQQLSPKDAVTLLHFWRLPESEALYRLGSPEWQGFAIIETYLLPY